MKGNWTPGPWTANAISGKLRYIGKSGFLSSIAIVSLPQLSEYDSVNSPHERIAKCNAILAANARLIAASPELAEAAQALLDVHTRDAEGMGYVTAKEWDKAVEDLAQAVRKAHGEKP